MKISKKDILFLVFGLILGVSALAQGALCSDIEPFCAGDQQLTFPNSNYLNSNQTSGEPGIDYGCLEEQPFPAWFFLQVEDTGNLTFTISQYENEDGTGAPLDVDFIVWGPFERGEEYCSGSQLNAGSLVDCSYLPDAVETMEIPNAQANEVYVVMITNFQQLPGYINLRQVNSDGGSTDCSILDSDLGDEVSVCGEDSYLLDGTTDEAEIYEWYVFNDATQEYEIIPGEDGPTYLVTEDGDYRLVVRDLVGDSSDMDEVVVRFYDVPVIGEAENLSICAEGLEFVDLTRTEAELLTPVQNPVDYEAVYFESQEDLEEDNEITSPQNFEFEDGKVIYARIRHIESGCYSPAEEFELGTFVFPEISLPETSIFCTTLQGDLLSTVSLGEELGAGYAYEWRDGNTVLGTEAVIRFEDIPQSHEIVLSIFHEESGCEIEVSTMPVLISGPEIVNLDISGSDFGEGYTVSVSTEGGVGREFAQFEFRLDDGPWRDNPVFNEVPPGSHMIRVREVNGCGEASSESFFLVGYPRFFTPNADGYNDTWRLINNGSIEIKRLFVFDRYGKLLKQLNPVNGQGWDGTYNGQPMPADDYWFRVEFVDSKTGNHQEYMSNFTLIR
ncbi:T9SS type B sorting domain-containing protein [Gramella sp. GC03-9]|uniref:T9SS type B sorting domain-containing protein n=1 Tax=Christiangramia oceanisediminis TaxID=2920386 RepID=A0A9X2L080_9FLAO|nr:T9SS type B sorting domain-containing protein [Gramella oceanisediminis]MCP9201441.1 T9SS type B sorting domain-containing protein [Gramella oceanisediminis]